MSRVGKYPVEIPQGVQVAIAGRMLTAKGKLGELKLELTDHVDAVVEGNHVTVKPRTQERQARMMWGTTRALVASIVKGVSTGYERSMEITGTGYRAAAHGDPGVCSCRPPSHVMAGESPPSTTFLPGAGKDVDGGARPRHDGAKRRHFFFPSFRRICSSV